MNIFSRERENVRIWLEKGLNGEQWVYVETRHRRRVVALDEFVALVKEKLKTGQRAGGILGRESIQGGRDTVPVLRIR